MNSLVQHLHSQSGDHSTSQSSVDPKLFVVKTTSVQTIYNSRLTDKVLVLLKVVDVIFGSRFLISLESSDNSGMGKILFLKSLDCHHSGENRISVVSASSSVQLSSLDHRLGGSKSLSPTSERRLFVVVAVKQHSFGLALSCGNFKEN